MESGESGVSVGRLRRVETVGTVVQREGKQADQKGAVRLLSWVEGLL